MYNRFVSILIALGLTSGMSAQGFKRLFKNSSFSGQVQADMQYCLKDSARDNSEYVNKFLSNIYVDGTYSSDMLNAGVRFEMYENPLPGFEADFKGVGVPNFYMTLRLSKISITGGDFYEQFGSGLILRAYQERSLGVDNALRGARVVYTPVEGVRIKALAGVQRNRWEWSDSWVKGGDVEIDIHEWLPAMSEHGQRLRLGGGFVSKHEEDELIWAAPGKRLNLPNNVAAASARLEYRIKNLSLQGEYAWKSNDPTSENSFIYRPGQALLLSASYFRRGLGVTLAAKHSDNMSFRSERTSIGNVLQLNYFPAFTRQHTYSLASFYPYATQTSGEIAFQADLFYKFPKGSCLGGAYGMDVRLNYSQVYSLKKTYEGGLEQPAPGTYGYTARLFGIGNEIYYRDVNVEVAKKMNSSLKLTMTYMNQLYNEIVRGKSGLVHANIGVVEALYRINKKMTIRGEVEYLATRQDEKDWAAALLEFSVSPHWIFTLSDSYNIGGGGKNYPLGSVAYSTGAHRVQISGGKQRAGYNCSGGVCRYIPATNGFAVNYSVNF